MILLNGELVDEKELPIDSGLYFGRGLFETILVKNLPVFLKEHLNRLNEGLMSIGIHRRLKDEEVLRDIAKLNCENSVVKIVVTEKNVIYTTRKNNYTEKIYKEGFKVKISSSRRNEYSRMSYLKSLNYLENILEHEDAIKEGFNEVIFLNTENKLAEGSMSNIFFIKDGKIYTPSIDCGLLNGTVRSFIINRYEVFQGKFTLETLMNCDAAFLTNSVMGVMRISKIGDKDLKNSNFVGTIRGEYKSYIDKY